MRKSCPVLDKTADFNTKQRRNDICFSLVPINGLQAPLLLASRLNSH